MYLDTVTTMPLGKQTEDRMRGHDIVCVHTMVGYLYSTYEMFRQNGYGGTESHFGIGGIWGSDASRGLDGVAWEFQDLAYTADANFNGNPTVISIETADDAPKYATDIPFWTPKQADRLVLLIAELCSPSTHRQCPTDWTCYRSGIPPVLIPDTLTGRRGIGYHRQGIDPWRIDNGVRWSEKYGKECPGPRRIAQLSSEIIPRVQSLLSTSQTRTDDDSMFIAKDFNGSATRYLILGTIKVELQNPSELASLVQRFGAVVSLTTETLDSIPTVRKATINAIPQQ